jgi:Tfp pilus assembly protein PilE
MSGPDRATRQRGFTYRADGHVTIIGILASIAVPVYSNYLRSALSEAKPFLLDIATPLQIQNGVYCAPPAV